MFAEDLSVFFQGLDATAATLAGAPVTGYINAGFEPVLMDGGGGMPAGFEPRFTLPTAQVPATALGRALVIASGPAAGTYLVRDIQHSGTGLTDLQLVAQI